jgi:hypothetical protein
VTRHLALALGLLVAVGAVQACPGDAAPRPSDTLLVLRQGGTAPLAFDAGRLAALPRTTLTQSLRVSSTAGAAAERQTVLAGVLLRDLLVQAGFGGANDRAARTAVVEALASDGYRAVFSWGELFNAPVGEQVLVITSQDGRPLDAAAGPLALRSLADLRPGPRHVRNLCALVVHR